MSARAVHSIPPVWDGTSRVLILGSFPSVKSRETGFFYGHPQNRFWRVLAGLFGRPVPQTIPEKQALLLFHSIALWDVIGSCEIAGSSDQSIRNPVPNDISFILSGAQIRAVFCNGSLARQLYDHYLAPVTGLPAMQLPSTSPANASYSLPRLLDAWSAILPFLEEETC